MVLFLHSRYRTTGGEERAVEDLAWLVREHLGEEVEVLERDSSRISRRAAAAGMVGGGLAPAQVARAVKRGPARIVHAHNVNPTFGWRALAAAREAGAKVVLHLHQYRLVCAVGVCFTHGADCTRCHGRKTLPGLRLNCRGSAVEAAVYAAGLSLWQRRLADCVDAFVAPSRFAVERLRALEAPVGEVHVVPQIVRSFATESAAPSGRYALVTSRLAPEKGIEVAIEACRTAGMPLVVAGDGPERPRLERLAGPEVRFTGWVGEGELASLRRGAAIALMPSRSGETFGLAAAEAMAAGLPVVASRLGALPELVPPEWLVPPADPAAMALAIGRLAGDGRAGARAIERARAAASPQAAARGLAAVYG